MTFDHATQQNLPLVLSVSEVAGILHIGKNSAYSLVNNGKIRCIHIGKTIRVPQSALLEYLNRPDQA